MGSASRCSRCTRPSTCRATRPASSSTWRCRGMAGREVRKGAASSPTVASPLASLTSTARRVGWASAAKTLSRRGDLTDTLTINGYVNDSRASRQGRSAGEVQNEALLAGRRPDQPLHDQAVAPAAVQLAVPSVDPDLAKAQAATEGAAGLVLGKDPRHQLMEAGRLAAPDQLRDGSAPRSPPP